MINLTGIIITIFFYKLAQKFKNYAPVKLFTPVLVSGVVIILFLKTFKIDYQTYIESASFLTFLLIPATICLGYPLYKNINILFKNKRTVYFSFIIAILSTFFMTYLTAKLLGTDEKVLVSMLPKSITAPIALEITKQLGGLCELSACIVVLTGVFGGMFGHKILKLIKVKDDVAIGLAIGCASHMIGTGKCLEKGSKRQTAASTLALVTVGILSVIFAPLILKILNFLF